MAASRVLLVDDNQIFGSQVVAAFSDVGIIADWVERGHDAMPLLSQPGSRPQLLIIDMVRPASAGNWLLQRVYGQNQTDAAGRPPLGLALVPVIGTFHDLPEGVEVQVKPIFPSQVVATARRLLGLAPATGRPTAPGLPVVQTGGAAVHRVPPTPSSPSFVDSLSDHPTEAHIPHPTFDQFEDSSDFGPADTLLAPSNIEELARAMTSGNSAAVPFSSSTALSSSADDLFDTPMVDTSMVDATADAVADENTSPRAALRPRTKPQFAAIATPIEPSLAAAPAPPLSPYARAGGVDEEGEGGEGNETQPLIRTLILPRSAVQDTALAGELSVVPLIDVVALLARQRQRGLLHIVSSSAAAAKMTVTVFFREGRIDLVIGSGLPIREGDLRIGRFILESAALSHAQIDEIEARRQSSPKLDGDFLGQRLCQQGLLQKDELRQALARQSTELLYAALGWKSGRFSFEHRVNAPRHVSSPELGGALELDAEALLLEGYRRIHDYHLIDKDAQAGAVYVTSGAALAHASDPLRQLGLSDSEVVVLGLCNGRLSLGEIARESRLPILEVARTVSRLEALRLCRRRLPALLAG